MSPDYTSISLTSILSHFEKESGDNLDDIDESDLGESWVLELLQGAVIRECFGKLTSKDENSAYALSLVCMKSVKGAVKSLLEEVLEECLCKDDDLNGASVDSKLTGAASNLICEIHRRRTNEGEKSSAAKNSLRLSRFLSAFEKIVLVPYCCPEGSLNTALLKLCELERCRGSWQDCECRENQTDLQAPDVNNQIEASCKRRKLADGTSLEQLEVANIIESSSHAQRLHALLEQTEIILNLMLNLGLVKIEMLTTSSGYNGTTNGKRCVTASTIRTIWASDIYQSRAHYYALLGRFELSISCLEEALTACKSALKAFGTSKVETSTKKTEILRQMIVRLLQESGTEDKNTMSRARKLLQSNHFTASICKDVFQFREKSMRDISGVSEFKQESIDALREQIVVLDNVFPMLAKKTNSEQASLGVHETASDLSFLKSQVFTEAFFAHHGYDSLLYDCLLTRCNPDYFSLFHDLEKPRNKLDVVLKHFVERVRRFCSRERPGIAGKLPDLAKARFAETWTHRRTHLGSHQLHVDSKNEGRTKHIENPVATFVLFLETVGDEGYDGQETTKDYHTRVSGPTVITDQVRGSEATTVDSAICFFAFPKPNRAVCFPGDLYHGVLPGKICSSTETLESVLGCYRHTLMISLWEELEETQIQHNLSPTENCPQNGNRIFGPCRSVCEEGAKNNTWMAPLLFSSTLPTSETHHVNVEAIDDDSLGVSQLKYAEPVFAGRVWEAADVGGKCGPGTYGIERCFQF